MTTRVITAEVSFDQALTVRNIIRVLFMIAVFLAIFSPTMVYVAAFSALLTLTLPRCRAKIPSLLRLGSIRLGFLYFLVVIFGVFYTPATVSDRIKELLVVFFPVFLLPLLISLFSDKKSQHRLIITLLVSAVFMAIRMFALSQNWIPTQWTQFFLFHEHYVQQAATLVGLGIYLALYLTLEANTVVQKSVFIGLSILLVVISLGYQQERVGMALSFIAVLIFFLQHLRAVRWLLLMIVGYALLVFFIYQISPFMDARVNRGIQQVLALSKERQAQKNPPNSSNTTNTASAVASAEDPSQTSNTPSAVALPENPSQTSNSTSAVVLAEDPSQTSIGLRYHTAVAAFQASMYRPIWGYGTGAFAMSHHSNPPLMSGDLLKYLNTTTPEIGSLFVLIRHGWIGVLIFIAFLGSWWWVCRPLGFRPSCLVCATLLILLLADCSYPAFYHSRAWLWLFAVLIAVAGGLFNDARPRDAMEKFAHENLTR